jgi:hypothetical protein
MLHPFLLQQLEGSKGLTGYHHNERRMFTKYLLRRIISRDVSTATISQTRAPAIPLHAIISTTCIPYFAKISQTVQKTERQTDTLRSLARSGQFLLLQLPHWKRMKKGSSVAKFGALFRDSSVQTEDRNISQDRGSPIPGPPE